MAATQPKDADQAPRWNGSSGCAWVEAQQLLDRTLQPFEDLLVAKISDSGAQHVLDVGCGTGSTTRAIARLLGTADGSVGIDISEQMIGVARVLAAEEGVAATFICADAQKHPFGSQRFDTIMSRFGVMFFEDSVQAFANLRSAAAEGASLQCVVWRSPADNPFMTSAERAAAPLLPNLTPRRPDAPGQFGFANERRVHSILSDSGWKEIDIRPLDLTCTLPEKELIRYGTRFGPVGIALQEADAQTRARVAAAVRAAFEPFVHGPEVRFTAACWLIAATSP
ncbi:MAG TPA: class I SAM-dependent methyltransferase [Steroidobacteraceae bacterium]